MQVKIEPSEYFGDEMKRSLVAATLEMRLYSPEIIIQFTSLLELEEEVSMSFKMTSQIGLHIGRTPMVS